MSVIKGLDIVIADINLAKDQDDLEDCLSGVTDYLDQKQETHTTLAGRNPGVADIYALSTEEKEAVTKIMADILDKAAAIHLEKDDFTEFFEDNELIENTIEEARRIDTVVKMVNFLGHSENFPKEIEKSGPSAWVLFDNIEGTIANQTQLDFSGDTSGFMNIMDSYVNGLKQFAETGHTPNPKYPTYGIEKFGHMMRSDTIDTLNEIGKRHSDVVKLRTMAVILEKFQPNEKDGELGFAYGGFQDDNYLAIKEFFVPNPNEYPEIDKYREWLQNDDLESFMEEIYAESLNAGADFLKYAKDDDKVEMAKNYIFAVGFMERCKQENLLVIEQLKPRNDAVNQGEVARFSSHLPDKIRYPKQTQSLKNQGPHEALYHD